MTLLADDRDAERAVVAPGAAIPSNGLTDERTDAELLSAVRAGEMGAYATLYELHAGSVRRLARRLCCDPHEADDVVSEVFANTLRAIQNGGGPRDEFALYVLRSVRNTVTKLRTRTDSARATPTELAALDRPAADDGFHVAGDVEHAFAELPQRFQEVLWTTAVQGRTPGEVSAALPGEQLDPGAVASLSQRARRALGRSYLRVSTQRPCRHPECGRVRNHLPGYVQQSAAAATVRRIEAHLEHCTECAEICAEMHHLNGRLRTTPWMALLAAAVRRLVLAAGTPGVPLAATAAAPVVAIAVAGVMVARHEPVDTHQAAASAVVARLERPPAPDAGTVAAAAGAAAAAGGVAVAVVSDSTTAVQVDVPRAPNATATPPGGAAATISNPLTPAQPDGTATPAPGPGAPGASAGAVGTVLDGAGNAIVPAVADGAGNAIVPAVADGTGSLLDDVGGTLEGVAGVVGVLPGGLPGTLDATGNLVGQVGDTVTNVVGTASATVGAVAGTAGATLTTVVATVDETVAGAGTAVGNAGTNLGGTLDDLLDGTGNPVAETTGNVGQTVDTLVTDVAGPGGVVDDLLGGLLGGSGGAGGSPPCVLFCGG